MKGSKHRREIVTLLYLITKFGVLHPYHVACLLSNEDFLYLNIKMAFIIWIFLILKILIIMTRKLLPHKKHPGHLVKSTKLFALNSDSNGGRNNAFYSQLIRS